MKALVYNGPGNKALENRPKPTLVDPTDAIIKITKTTICGTDLHILKGDVATAIPAASSAMKAWASSRLLGWAFLLSNPATEC